MFVSSQDDAGDEGDDGGCHQLERHRSREDVSYRRDLREDAASLDAEKVVRHQTWKVEIGLNVLKILLAFGIQQSGMVFGAKSESTKSMS